ncbi:MAG: hypothetical protein Q9203_005220 [Teloschistes exilis]
MVYRGKPSQACLHCRRRKLRCDLEPSGCSQCSRASLVCQGYRDTNRLRIHDETTLVKHKVSSRQDKSIVKAPSVAIEDQARSYFLYHYAIGFSKVFDVLALFDIQPHTDRHLYESVTAASLAFFSFQFDCDDARRMAAKHYLLALPMVNQALKAPQSVASDATLLAILMLDLFEKILHNDPGSTESRMSHVNGALALVKLRGHDRFQQYISLRLSARLSTSLLISCVAAGAPVPPGLVQLRTELEQFLDKSDPKWQLTGLAIEFVNLQSRIRGGSLPRSDAISELSQLDSKLVRLAETMPRTWHFDRVLLAEPSERALEMHFDVYPNHAVTQATNVLRIKRILVNNALRSECAGQSTKTHQTIFGCKPCDMLTHNVDELAKDICASTAQFTGLSKSPVSRTYGAADKACCFTLLFPMYVAAVYASSSTMIRPWVMKQLSFLCEFVGIRQAKDVAGILEKDADINPWGVYTMLGSYAFAA